MHCFEPVGQRLLRVHRAGFDRIGRAVGPEPVVEDEEVLAVAAAVRLAVEVLDRAEREGGLLRHRVGAEQPLVRVRVLLAHHDQPALAFGGALLAPAPPCRRGSASAVAPGFGCQTRSNSPASISASLRSFGLHVVLDVEDDDIGEVAVEEVADAAEDRPTPSPRPARRSRGRSTRPASCPTCRRCR